MSSDSREALAERQKQWMQQRQAELDRRKAVESVCGAAGRTCSSSANGSGEACGGGSTVSSQGGGAPQVGGAEVLDRLAEQIAARLQVEVRKENARLMQDGAVGAQVESLLERHIASNNCPVCFELMTGSEHAPMLLFPCGHTFCQACLCMHLEKLGRSTCPYCREKVQSRAPNVSLRQVIDGFVERQQSLARGEVLPELVQSQANVASAAQQRQQQHYQQASMPSAVCGAGGGGSSEATKYAEQYRAYSMRCRVMRNQRLESHAEVEALGHQHGTASKVLAHLSNEEEAARQRLEAARVELEVVQAQRHEQAQKLEGMGVKLRELEQIERLVGETQASLEAERAKALLLVQNFSPELAESLEREFEAGN